MSYTPPIRDICFALDHIAGLPRLAETGAFPDFTPDLTPVLLGEAGRLAAEIVAPLNRVGDVQGTRLLDTGEVRTAEGFADAYRQFVKAGWGGLSHPPRWGGQGLPRMLSFAVLEMLQSANVSWALCPMLTQGAVEALLVHGTEELQRLYLPRLVSGEWPGTMNLTEPQAGSDVGALKTRAEPLGGGAYRITGTKIFITWGEHDMAENIVHLVLARLPDAPPGTRGISLFLVPKFLVNPDGSLGERNDVRCVGLEEKLGIHGSPTCVMAYGERDGATGWLIGEENRGMACMFTMMNNARLSVGLQGVSVGEAACQMALAFARERRQGKPYGRQHEVTDMLPIIEHADVRRMLMTMKAKVEAARAICYANAAAIDLAHVLEDEHAREDARAREELLTPVSKAFSTDLGVEIASLGIQVHGGMGYIEETGAAQFLRDARIAPIYEGTNGIQALDLVNRKLPMRGGAVARAFLDEARTVAEALKRSRNGHVQAMARPLAEAVLAVAQATEYLIERLRSEPVDALGGATPYLRAFGMMAGGHYLGLGALAAAQRADDPHMEARLAVARFYAENLLPEAGACAAAAMTGRQMLYALEPEQMDS